MKNLKTILLFTLLLCFGTTNAAIIYTDITDGQPGGIDFNQDGIMEFDIGDMMGTGDAINYWANPNNNIYAIDDASWDVPLDLTLNTTIDAGGNWEGFGDAAVAGWGGPALFAINVDRYLGMKFDLGGNIYYGWVRVEVTENGVDAWGDPAYMVTYKDYAYEDMADAAILAGAMPAVGNVDVTGITVTGAEAATNVPDNGNLQMSAAVLPANATDATVTWSVTNGTGTATINTTGLLSGGTQGTVTVIATAIDGSGVIGQITITVEAAILVTGITVTGQAGTITVADGSTLQMLATILPANAADQTVTWSVTNGTGSATINTNGVLTGTSEGTVTVFATANDGSGITGQTMITVTIPLNVLITNLTILTPNGQTEITILNGTLQMILTVAPGNATNQAVTWSVLNQTGQATIDANGLLTGVSNGTVLVKATATDGSGATAQQEITINMTEEEEEETNGIDDNQIDPITIYPNPFVNEININTELNGIVMILDLSGKIVHQSTTANQTIYLDHLESGIYMLVLTSDSKSYTQKIIKK